MPLKAVSFTLPEQQNYTQLERLQRLATAIMGQQGLHQPETQTVPGYPLPWTVQPSPLEYVGKLAGVAATAYGEKQAEKKAKETQLAEQAKMAEALRQYKETGDPQALMASMQTQPAALDLIIQDARRKRLMEALQQQPGQPGAPQPQGQQPAPMPQVGGPAGGVPMAAWLEADPSGKAYMEQLGRDTVEVRKPQLAAQYAPPVQIPTPGGQITAFPSEFPDVRREMTAQALNRQQQPPPQAPQPLPPAGPPGGAPNLARPVPGAPTPAGAAPTPIPPSVSPQAPARPLQGPIPGMGPPGQMPRTWSGPVTMPGGAPVPQAPSMPVQQPVPLPPAMAPKPVPGQAPGGGAGEPVIQPFNPQPLPPGAPLPSSPPRPGIGAAPQQQPRRAEGAITIPVPGKPPEPLPPGVPLSYAPPQRPMPAFAGTMAPFGISGPQPPGMQGESPPMGAPARAMPAPGVPQPPQGPAMPPAIGPQGGPAAPGVGSMPPAMPPPQQSRSEFPVNSPALPKLPAQMPGTIPPAPNVPRGTMMGGKGPLPVAGKPRAMKYPQLAHGLTQRAELIQAAAGDWGVDPNIMAYLFQQESSGQPGAVNPQDSKKTGSPSFGLGQLQPGTAKQYGKQYGIEDNIHDPVKNVYTSTAYIADLLKQYRGDYRKALAAYNHGPGNVNKLVSKHGERWFERLNPDTRSYVNTIMRNAAGGGNLAPPGDEFSSLASRGTIKLVGDSGQDRLEQGNRFSGIPGLGQSPSPEKATQQARSAAGGKALDEAFAKEYASGMGAIGDVPRQLANMRQVIANLSDPTKNMTGPVLGMMPDALLKFTNPEAVNTRQLLEEVVQRGLRPILGAQFTEKEGERLIKRMYDPGLPEKDNLMRVQRLAAQMEIAYANKVDAMRYFDQHGSLMGWQGKLPTIADFEQIGVGGGGGQPDIMKQADEILRGNR